MYNIISDRDLVFLASPSRESLTLTYENGLYGSLNWIIAFRRWMNEETDYYRSVEKTAKIRVNHEKYRKIRDIYRSSNWNSFLISRV